MAQTALDVAEDKSRLARLTGNLIIGDEITALLELEQHCRPSFQGINDIQIWAHDLLGMLYCLLE